MEALAQLLTRERLLVELLVFKLVEMRQLLLAGETRFLGWAGEEVDRAAGTVRDAELERALLVSELCAARGIEEATLGELVADAPEPWRSLLEDAHLALRAGATEIGDLLQTNRRLAEAGARSIAETMGEERQPLSTYGPTGRADASAARRYEQVL
ncbi:MAG: flagellar export chaperone FlgN [Mycobacteriales bacterium]